MIRRSMEELKERLVVLQKRLDAERAVRAATCAKIGFHLNAIKVVKREMYALEREQHNG